MTLAYRDANTRDSPLARWDTRWKLTAILVASFTIAVLQHPGPLIVAFLLSLMLVLSAGLSFRTLYQRAFLVLLGVFPFFLVLPWQWTSWDEHFLPIAFSSEGFRHALLIGLRCVTIGMLISLLIGTAPLHRIWAAAHALKIPAAMVLIAQLAHRYTYLLFDEARRLRIALRTRGFRAGTNLHSYRTLGHTAGILLVRGGERGERVSAAMRCRGFDGQIRVTTPFQQTWADIAGGIAMLIFCTILITWDRL